MSASPVKIGPFVGGLNTYSDTTAVADNEVVELTNFDVDIDGSLVTRPPLVYEKNGPAADAQSLKLLGWFHWTDGTDWLIASSNEGTPTTYVLSATTGLWVTITATFAATAMVQYQNKAWLVADPTEADPGGTWDPTALFTATAGIKKGKTAVIYKERLWVGEGGTGATSSRLYFSDAAVFGTFGASSFLDVKTGDGQTIVDMIVYSDVITIFKENSTYIFAYDSKPTTGQVRLISATIGISGKDCVFEYETILFLFHNRSVYSITNWNYQKLNIKVPFNYINSQAANLLTPFSMSQVGDRLVVRYYDLYYVYGLKTRVWAMWSSTVAPPLGKFFLIPQLSTAVTPLMFYATGQWKAATITHAASLYSFLEDWTVTRIESIHWSLTSKTYDFESPYTFKKLSWWGVDAISKSNILAKVFPVTYGRAVTWDQAHAYTWNQAHAFTWARFGSVAIEVDTSVTVQGSINRVFVKFLKTVRFRQINFNLSGTVDGTSTTSPMRIFGMTIFADTKEKVVAQVT